MPARQTVLLIMSALLPLASHAGELTPLPGATPAVEINPWAAWMARADATMAGVNGYSAIFHKREMIDEVLRPEEVMEFKFMKPFSVYLKWINPTGKGGEAIFTKGWNKNRVRVHPGGIWGIFNFNLAPDCARIMKMNRHPISWIGMGIVIEMLGENVRRAMGAGEFITIPHPETLVFGKRAEMLEGQLPADRLLGYYCRRTILYADPDTGLPLKIQTYDWSDRLVEEYGFENFKSDPEYTLEDFSPVNPGYRF